MRYVDSATNHFVKRPCDQALQHGTIALRKYVSLWRQVIAAFVNSGNNVTVYELSFTNRRIVSMTPTIDEGSPGSKKRQVPMRTIAIGDIHGCHLALETLLDVVAPTSNDRIVCLGDYIDRGPDSRAVVERLLHLADVCDLVPLLGNHELMLLLARDSPEDLDFWLTCGGEATLKSYGGAIDSIPASHMQFFENCRRFYETDDFLFLHANYATDLDLESHSDYPLFWQHLTTATPPPHKSGKTAIVGHTPQPDGEVLDLGHIVCVDTYCFGGGWLTGLDVETHQAWQVDRYGKLRVIQ